MDKILKKAFLPAAVVVGFLMFLGAIGNGVGTANAEVEDGAQLLTDYGLDGSDDCDDAFFPAEEGDYIVFDEGDSDKNWSDDDFDLGGDDEALQLEVGESAVICVEPGDGDGNVTFDSDDLGEWTDAACGDDLDSGDEDGDGGEWTDDACQDVSGEGTDRLIVPESYGDDGEGGVLNNDLDVIIVTYTCDDEGGIALATITQEEGADDDVLEFWIMCKGVADEIEVTVRPESVEIVPAVGNSAHSLILVELWDEDGGPPLPDTEVQYTVDQCAIETNGVDSADELDDADDLLDAMPVSYVAWHTFANLVTPDGSETSDLEEGLVEFEDSDDDLPESGFSAAIFHADIGGAGHTDGSCEAGIATVTIIVEVSGDSDLVETVEITIVGPPAAIEVEASPTSVVCGEKSTIVATVVDSIGQDVSDHTVVEAVTNAGGVLGGTGAVAAFGGPVVPISSTIAGTFGGDATMFLITSESHSGTYEVIVTTGGTAPGFFGFDFEFSGEGFDFSGTSNDFTAFGGLFSTAPISAQVTVECTIQAPAPAPTIVAPDTGTGITPPSTGDAGLLAGSNGSSWSLFAIGGMVAFALAGLATLGFARR